MLVEYYFEIKYTKGIDNARADVLSRMLGLQNNDKRLIEAVLKMDIDRKIRYNYLQLTGIYKALISKQE